MKDKHLVIRMCGDDIYNNTLMMRGFYRSRLNEVLGVAAIVVGKDSQYEMYHLSRIRVDLIKSPDTQQQWARLSWDRDDCTRVENAFDRMSTDLARELTNMRNNRRYVKVNLAVPSAFSYVLTELAYTPSAVRKIIERDAPKTLADFTTEEILNHLRERLKAKITIEL